jgi:hypothetical protein
MLTSGPERSASQQPSSDGSAASQKSDKTPIAQSLDREKGPSAELDALIGKPQKLKRDDDELTKLLKERYNAAQREVRARLAAHIIIPQNSLEEIFGCFRRLHNSELELSDKPTDRVTVLEKHVKVAKWFEKVQEDLFKSDVGNPESLENARYWRLDAEIQLLKAKRKAKAATPK